MIPSLLQCRHQLAEPGSTATVLCLGLAVGLAWLVTTATPQPGDDTDTVLLCGIAAFGLAACAGMFRFARSRAPFLVLLAEGFSSPGFRGTVPWLAAAGVTVVGGRGINTVFALAPDVTIRQEPRW